MTPENTYVTPIRLAFLLLASCAMYVATGHAQSTSAAPADTSATRSRQFEVASVKPTFSGRPLSSLLDHLSGELAAPVIDRTALDGMYDVHLEYEPQRFAVAARTGLDPNSTESPKPPLANAVERQLGLKLTVTTGDVAFVIIDGADKPMPD